MLKPIIHTLKNTSYVLKCLVKLLSITVILTFYQKNQSFFLKCFKNI